MIAGSIALIVALGGALPAEVARAEAGSSTCKKTRAKKPKPAVAADDSDKSPDKAARSDGERDAAPASDGGAAVAELLEKARQLHDALEYDQVIPITEQLLARPDITVEQRLDAYLLQGSCLAIVGNPIDAEKPFRFLLRGRPDFDMPSDTPPKILAVFRKVQVEERAIADQMRELERQRVLKELLLESDADDEASGGDPLPFEVQVRDPRGMVSKVSLNYRRGGQPGYSSIALEPDEGGRWKGALPGEWTASPTGFDLEYFISTQDREGRELVTLANALDPRKVSISPGEVRGDGSFFGSAWFWAAAVSVVVASGAAGYLVYRQASALPNADFYVHLEK